MDSAAAANAMASEGVEKCHTDPSLRGTAYSKFIIDLNERNMINYRLDSKEEIGVFFVRKKMGNLG